MDLKPFSLQWRLEIFPLNTGVNLERSRGGKILKQKQKNKNSVFTRCQIEWVNERYCIKFKLQK